MSGTVVLTPTEALAVIIPEDLGTCVELGDLRRSVLDVVDSVGSQLPLTTRLPDGQQWNVRSLLSSLTYALARGSYGAEALCERIQWDADLRYFTGSTTPDTHVLRWFRRRHASVLEAALARLIAPTATGRSHTDSETESAAREEAQRRYWAAVRADSIALDF